MIFDLFKTSKKEDSQSTPPAPISREELREFLIHNRLQGDLLKRVNALKAQEPGITNYQALEMLMDYSERNQ